GTPVANRPRVELEALVGFFVNTLALRLDFSGGPDVGALLAQVRDCVLQAQAHQDLPFEQVVEAVRPQRSLSHSPVFQLMFAWQGGALALPQGGEGAQDLRLALRDLPHRRASFDLSLELREEGGRIRGQLVYAQALFEPDTLARYLGHLRALLQGLVRDDGRAVDAIPILGDAERGQVLRGWNRTRQDYRQDLCVHELFEHQAQQTPRALALQA
ncbi:condensation domain-containing protein, partial [Pelomonas sp. CA6]|uniref:condensation domain-containing protein n=1 Tax=Pelomonas sp. CA6 TaxID=2907999 RepID=UPI001F4BEF4D